MNKAILMGRLVRDPELRSTQNGDTVCNFTVACDKYGKGADFLDCVAWNKTAEFVKKYFPKGRMISLVGRIQTRDYTDKTGNKRKAVEIVVEEVSFCGDKLPNQDPDYRPGGFYDVQEDEEPLPF